MKGKCVLGLLVPDDAANVDYIELVPTHKSDSFETPVQKEQGFDSKSDDKEMRLGRLSIDPTSWRLGNQENPVLRKTGTGSLLAGATFSSAGYRGIWPTMAFSTPQDYSGCRGIRFKFQILKEAKTPHVRFVLKEAGSPDKSHWVTMEGIHPPVGKVTEWNIPFSDMKVANWDGNPPDPNGKLDLDRVGLIQIGYDVSGSESFFEILSVELIR